MKFCPDCGNSVPDNSARCSNCGKGLPSVKYDEQNPTRQQPVQQDDTFLKVLCILTIVGASISLLSLVFTFKIAEDVTNSLFLMQIASLLIATGKMTGAILMLQKRLKGLHIYTVASVTSIVLTTMMAFGLNTVSYDEAIADALMTLSFIIAIIISVTFLVLYWLKVNRRHLS